MMMKKMIGRKQIELLFHADLPARRGEREVKMKKIFENKVIRNGIVDTKKYRYILRTTLYGGVIERIPIEYLDTTMVINGWEIVKVINK